MFELHSQLEKDCFVLGQFPLCQLLLMNDANYPWFILVPVRTNICEIYELSDSDQQQFWQESSQLAAGLMQVFGGDKMNIGALGNVVPQLHIHHIVRYTSDVAWPAPVWGKVVAVAYTDAVRETVIDKLLTIPFVQSNLTRQD